MTAHEDPASPAGHEDPTRPATQEPGDTWAGELTGLDTAVYAAIALTPTPRLDRGLRLLSRAADHSKLSLAASAIMAVSGGPRGRRAATGGLASVAATSAVVNLLVKPLARRRRPDRTAASVPLVRQVPMPESRSFPSGHSAAAVAFASGASRSLPAAGAPLYVLAALVSYSRVHAGVHFPGDVVAGALIGVIIGDLTGGRLAAGWE
jgi:membrane-associated phospholipid phosphatase